MNTYVTLNFQKIFCVKLMISSSIFSIISFIFFISYGFIILVVDFLLFKKYLSCSCFKVPKYSSDIVFSSCLPRKFIRLIASLTLTSKYYYIECYIVIQFFKKYNKFNTVIFQIYTW